MKNCLINGDALGTRVGPARDPLKVLKMTFLEFANTGYSQKFPGFAGGPQNDFFKIREYRVFAEISGIRGCESQDGF